MSVNRMFPSGGYEISAIVRGYLFTQRYYGYSKREAVRLFKQACKGQP